MSETRANMDVTILPDNRDALYLGAFSATNPSNVKSDVVAAMVTPFQPSSQAPFGMPPVRYPDLTTMGGFLSNPEDDESGVRQELGKVAASINRDDPTPMDIDSFGTVGDRPVKNKGPERLAQEELFERAFKPRMQDRPTTAWEYES